MTGTTGGAIAGLPSVDPAVHSPIQVVSPSALLDAPASVRGLVAFVAVLALGGLLLWRYEPFVARSADASMARPLSSLVYGAAAHAVIAFGGVYLINQLAGLEAFGYNAGAVGFVVGLVVVLLAASLGFTVVGTTIVGFVRDPSYWYGLLVGALLAALAAFVGSLAGATLWFVLVSMGIGGPARRWVHADEISDARDASRE